MKLIHQDGNSSTSEVGDGIRGIRIDQVIFVKEDVQKLLNMCVYPGDITKFLQRLYTRMHVPPKSRAELVKELSELHHKLHTTGLGHKQAFQIKEQIAKVEQLLIG